MEYKSYAHLLVRGCNRRVSITLTFVIALSLTVPLKVVAQNNTGQLPHKPPLSPSYIVIDMGEGLRGNAINNKCQVVGSDNTGAFVWPAGSIPSISSFRSVADLNDNGDMVGDLAAGTNPSKGSAVVINGGPPKYLSDYMGSGSNSPVSGQFINSSGKVAGDMSPLNRPSFYETPRPPGTKRLPPSFYKVKPLWHMHSTDVTFGPGSTQFSVAPVAWWWNIVRKFTLTKVDSELNTSGRIYSMNDGGLTIGGRSGTFYWGASGDQPGKNNKFFYYLIGEEKVTDGFKPVDINNENLVLGQKKGKLVVRKASQPNGVPLVNGVPVANGQSGDLVIDESGEPKRITNSIGNKPYIILGRRNADVTLWRFNSDTQKYQIDWLQDLIPKTSNWYITVATDINDYGCIAATGTNTQGQSHGLILVPVEVKEVSFGGTNNNYWELWADDCGATNVNEVANEKKYSAPQWKDVNGNSDAMDVTEQEHNYAVAYTRNTKPKIGAKFKIASASNLGAIKLKANGPDGIEIPETAATVNGDEVSIALTATSKALPDSIKFYNRKEDAKAFKLEWEIKVGNSDWSKIGTTKHTVYLTLTTPITSLRQETLFDLGCRNADGEIEELGARNKAYGEFTDRVVKRIDSKQMTYWLNNQMGCVDSPVLLQREDANGNCQSWSGLFRDVLRIQGIHADRIKVWPRSDTDTSVIVKTWTFIEPSHGPAEHPYIAEWLLANGQVMAGQDAHDVQGVPGQGNPNPPGSFNGHWITESGSAYYDPSYGSAVVSGTNKGKLYEDGAFEGFGASYSLPSGDSFDSIRRNNTTSQSAAEVDYKDGN